VLRDAGARWLLFEAWSGPLVAELQRHGTPLEALVRIGGADEDALAAPRFPGLVLREYDELLGASGHAAQVPGTASRAPLEPFEPARVGLDDAAQLYYTSGTTAAPKGVVLTHGNVGWHTLATLAELCLDERCVWGHVAPMFHLADAWATLAVTAVGGRHAMHARFDAGATLAFLERERVTQTNLIPTMLTRLVHEPSLGERRLSLERVLSGGAPIAPALVRAVVERLGCEYVQTYGMTETSPFLTFSLPTAAVRALGPDAELATRCTTGRPTLGVELEVVLGDGTRVARDGESVGEIRVRGPSVTPGYWNRPDATAAAFADGWLATGDLAVVDARGYVTSVDRKKDVVLSGGENVYGPEVERVLAEHPDLLEVAVYGLADDEWGEVVACALVPRPGRAAAGPADEARLVDEVLALARERLAGFQRPRAWLVLPELPRTGSGKVAKRLLRDLHAARRAGPGRAGP
jgi:acyl-CoA synthetase (AMP-forming)/AMP-acid ligase II